MSAMTTLFWFDKPVIVAAKGTERGRQGQV
jgi:hypothetical protein